MVLSIRDLLGEDPPLNTVAAKKALPVGAAITLSNGLLCHACKNLLVVSPLAHPRKLTCAQGHESTVTAAQRKAEHRRHALASAEGEARAARLALVPRYPSCSCGGPLMLPEQAGKGRMTGRLFCGSCGVQTGVTQKATAEQIEKARAAAKAEGFEVPS